MNVVALIYSLFATISLVPICVHGQVYSQVERSTRQMHMTENWRSWQWYLKDTDVSMHVKSAWLANYTGKGILVAVVDDGVKIDHPVLKSNFNLTASYDFLENRNISTYDYPSSHGTNCAGIIAGADNADCGVGVAFDAQISSIRIWDENRGVSDESKAKALSFKRDMIDIYSNSWGPGDMGFEVEGPGPRLEEAFKNGTRLGRHGKGSIYVFAAGNGGVIGDSCAFNGYVNSIHTIAISGVNWDGSVPAYSEQCAAIMAVTYGQDMLTYSKFKPPLITANGAKDCTERFPGTSGTTAMASGIIALALQAKPDLTWRDVQHLIVRSSKPLNPPISKNRWRVSRPRPSWITNAAGLRVSSHYGFGLMDASKMIEYAKKWRSVPQQLSCEVKLNVSNFNSSKLVIPSRRELRLTLSLSQDDCRIQYLEHMQVEVNLQSTRRGYLEIFSKSPNRTKSKLFYSRTMDIWMGLKNFKNWRVTSLHYWGEKPYGDWNITIRNTRRSNTERVGRVFGLKLILYGTEGDPLKNNTHVDRKTKKIETVSVSLREKEIPIHGGYSKWSYWGQCSKTCGEGGFQKRSRRCDNPKRENGGRDCSRQGAAKEIRKCRRYPCPVHGGYSTWGTWSQCSVKCGGGHQQRSRTCTNPRPAYGGRNCDGLSVKTQRCGLIPCPQGALCPSGWTLFNSYCYIASSTSRTWNKAKAHCDKLGGDLVKITSAEENQFVLALARNLTVKSVWIGLKWNSKENDFVWADQALPTYRKWSRGEPNGRGREQCGTMYITGNRAGKWNDRNCGASRTYPAGSVCKNIVFSATANPDTACKNIAYDSWCQIWSKNCSDPTVSEWCKKTCGRCKGATIHGGYSNWGEWGPCNRACAGGTQQRSRSCNRPSPSNGGKDCRGIGPATESRECNTQNCEACKNIVYESLCQMWSKNCSDPTVNELCKKTCGRCEVSACTNIMSDRQCEHWLKNNHCSKFGVTPLCKKTCGSC